MTVPGLGGRPKAFKTVEECESKMQYYFDSICVTSIMMEPFIAGYEPDEKTGEPKPVFEQRPVLNDAGETCMSKRWLESPSIYGLCESLGVHIDTLHHYQSMEEFSEAIKCAKQRIAKYIEVEKLYDKDSSRGAQFNLNCNHNWKPAQTTELTGRDGRPIQTETAILTLNPIQREHRIEELIAQRQKALP